MKNAIYVRCHTVEEEISPLRIPVGALREGLPPKPPAKERPNYFGGTRLRQGPSIAGRQQDGGGETLTMTGGAGGGDVGLSG